MHAATVHGRKQDTVVHQCPLLGQRLSATVDQGFLHENHHAYWHRSPTRVGEPHSRNRIGLIGEDGWQARHCQGPRGPFRLILSLHSEGGPKSALSPGGADRPTLFTEHDGGGLLTPEKVSVGQPGEGAAQRPGEEARPGQPARFWVIRRGAVFESIGMEEPRRLRFQGALSGSTKGPNRERRGFLWRIS